MTSSCANIWNATWFDVITPAAEAVITVAEAKAQLNMLSTETFADSLISAQVSAATGYCQAYSWLQFVSATYETKLPLFVEKIQLWKNPVSSITHIKYYDSSNVLQTLATTDYEYIKINGVMTIKIKTFPATYDRLDAVVIRFVAGFGVASAVPEEIKSAIKLFTAHLYEHREDVVFGSSPSDIPSGTKALLDTVAVKAFI